MTDKDKYQQEMMDLQDEIISVCNNKSEEVILNSLASSITNVMMFMQLSNDQYDTYATLIMNTIMSGKELSSEEIKDEVFH